MELLLWKKDDVYHERISLEEPYFPLSQLLSEPVTKMNGRVPSVFKPGSLMVHWFHPFYLVFAWKPKAYWLFVGFNFPRVLLNKTMEQRSFFAIANDNPWKVH